MKIGDDPSREQSKPWSVLHGPQSRVVERDNVYDSFATHPQSILFSFLVMMTDCTSVQILRTAGQKTQ